MQNQVQHIDQLSDLKVLDLALQVRAASLIMQTVTEYNASKEPEKIKDNELFQQAKVNMTKAHIIYLTFAIYLHKISEVDDANLRGHLEQVARTFALD